MPSAFGFILDTQQTRVKKGYDCLATLVSGEDWSKRYRAHGYVDPINGVAMLRPYPLTPEWSTTYTGNYARYRLTDYTGLDSNWIETGTADKEDGFIKWLGDPGGGFNPTAMTAHPQPRNGSMYLAWYAANVTSQAFVQMECGWGPTGQYTVDPLTLRFWSDGTVEVWESGGLAGTYDFTGSAGKVLFDGTSDGFPSSTAQQWIYVVMMPYRLRELYVIGNKGGGFSHTFEGIDPSASDPTIIPQAQFWWRMPLGTVQAACAPCTYETSGYLVGTKTYWPKAPQSDRQLSTHVYGFTHGGSGQVSLCQPDNPDSPWSAGGGLICRARMDMQGNGITTPNISGIRAYYPTVTKPSFAGNRVLDDYVTKASISVSDSPTDARVTFEIREPEYVNDNIAGNILSVSNRAFTLQLGGVPCLTGATEGTKYTEALDDMTRRLSIESRDKWKALEHYLFTDPTPLDGMNWADAVKLILTTAGIPDGQIDVEDQGYILPVGDGNAKGDWAVLIEAGDSAADWLKRLHENYAATWFMGFVPSGGATTFKLVSPESLGSASVFTLYDNMDDATANTDEDDDAIQYVYREYNDHILEPESNSVWIMGRDARTGKPLVGFQDDEDSQDPTIDPATADPNSLRELRKYGLIDSTITTYSALARALEILVPRLTVSRTIAEFTCELMVKDDGTPVWRGDVVTLNGFGDYRIKSFSTEVLRDYDEQSGWYWRPTKYVAEKITDVSTSVSSHGGYSLQEVIALHALKMVSKTITRRDLKSLSLGGQKPLYTYPFDSL